MAVRTLQDLQTLLGQLDTQQDSPPIGIHALPRNIPPIVPTSKSALPTVTGSKGGNAALANLITILVKLGIVLDQTS
jgi:hypothetical protein